MMFRRIEVPEGLCQTVGTFDVSEGSSCAGRRQTPIITQGVMIYLMKVWNWLYYRLSVSLCPMTYMYSI